MALSDLTVEAFLILRNEFFNHDGSPRSFSLREKRNTQYDPLDEYIAAIIKAELTDANCQRSPGPLTSPDLVIYRRNECENVPSELLRDDLSRIVAIEVKKLERSETGRIARPTGLDYNTTPPCGTVRIYDSDSQPVDIRAFYLFVCQEATANGMFILSSLALCDGNTLNADFDLYLRITTQREKEVGLGTYKDGANRNRPMLIFANPLGADILDRSCTLISSADFSGTELRVRLVYRISRSIPNEAARLFYAYRKAEDIPVDWNVSDVVDPFPQPAHRVTITQQRGKFKLPFSLG